MKILKFKISKSFFAISKWKKFLKIKVFFYPFKISKMKKFQNYNLFSKNSTANKKEKMKKQNQSQSNLRWHLLQHANLIRWFAQTSKPGNSGYFVREKIIDEKLRCRSHFQTEIIKTVKKLLGKTNKQTNKPAKIKQKAVFSKNFFHPSGSNSVGVFFPKLIATLKTSGTWGSSCPTKNPTGRRWTRTMTFRSNWKNRIFSMLRTKVHKFFQPAQSTGHSENHKAMDTRVQKDWH